MKGPSRHQAPKIDRRTAADIVAQLAGSAESIGRLEQHTTHPDAAAGTGPGYPFAPWRDYDPATGAPRGRSAALIGIFARFAELLIERVNRVPEKAQLAFLDLLGAERLPPRPARVPLTFTLAAGSARDAEVPAGTRAAAPPPPGSKDPIVFETEQPLTLTAARLANVLTLDPERDCYGDWGTGDRAFPVFEGERAVEHILYIGDSELLGRPGIDELSLTIKLKAETGAEPLPLQWGAAVAAVVERGPGAENGAERLPLQWELWDGEAWVEVAATADEALDDGTNGLTQTGTIVLPKQSPQPETTVAGRTSRWLRCRAISAIIPSMILPQIQSITTQVKLNRPVDGDAPGLTPDAAFANSTPIDLARPFYPFGERPRTHDALYLANREAFSAGQAAGADNSSTDIQLDIALANGEAMGEAGGVQPAPDLALAWECWTGSHWELVGTSSAPNLIELDDASAGFDERQEWIMVAQGRVRVGAEVTAILIPDRESPPLVSVDTSGRFVARASVASVQTGPIVLELKADLGDQSERVWMTAVPGTQPAVVLVPVMPHLLLDEDRIELEVEIEGDEADNVKTLRLTSGRTERTVSAKQGEPLRIALRPGRNDFLIEALSEETQGKNRLIAAKTATIRHKAAAPVARNGFADGTYTLTQSGVVSLQLPAAIARTPVNGQDGYWLRARIVQGDYGKEAHYVLENEEKPEEGYKLVPATLAPPLVESIRIGYECTLKRPPPICLAYNQLEYADYSAAVSNGDQTFAAFTAPTADDRPSLYLGFLLPAGRSTFPQQGFSLYAQPEEPQWGVEQVPSSGPPVIAWQYWNGSAWAALGVEDGTEGFTRAGVLRLLPPPDIAPRTLFGRERWWLRARLVQGGYAVPPRLAWLRLNTTSAVQAISIADETLGSSSGAAGQVVRSARAPVLIGQQLLVREPERPAASALSAATADGPDPASPRASTAASDRGTWVPWHQVPDLYGSGPGDRHYLLDRLTGEIRFGDGVNGRIPPPGTSNLRLARYRTGGGSAGNCAAGSITQLKTTVPYVDKITNPAPAAGGADAEGQAAMLERTPRVVRHRGRAVTPEDLEDQARLASADVARARCVPLCDLAADPHGRTQTPGAVSIIVVPRSGDAKPLPTLALIEQVRAHLAARADATARVSVVGPGYLEVSVTAEIALAPGAAAGAVERAVLGRVAAFLHPLTGGLDGTGWDFGRTPHRSDFLALIEQVPGVDHCRFLALETEDPEALRGGGHFLVHSGEHRITPVFAPA